MQLERRSGAVHYAAMTTAIATPRAKRAGRAAVALIGLVLTAMVAGCATPPPAPRVFDLTFAHLPILSLDVARIEVVLDYVPSLKPPNVEHLFPMPPETGLRRWAADRLKAKGRKGSARFVIVNAAVTEAALPVTKGLKGAFTKEQSERYEAVIEASLEILDARGIRKGFASARVSRSRTVREDASLNDREAAWFTMTEALLNDFDKELEKNIRQYLLGYLL
jgi:hypothetical protein